MKLSYPAPEILYGRFRGWVFRYGNVPANVGSVDSNSSGQYLLRRAMDCGGEAGYQKAEHGDGYKGYINSPTTLGSLLVRTLVKSNGSDLTYVREVLEECKLLTILRQHTSRYAGAPLSNATFAGYQAAGTNTSLAIMELLSQLAAANSPVNTSDTARVNSEMTAA